jgi:hypothetical protein
MPLDFEGSYIERSALVIMHYQADVFTIWHQHHWRRSLGRHVGQRCGL